MDALQHAEVFRINDIFERKLGIQSVIVCPVPYVITVNVGVLFYRADQDQDYVVSSSPIIAPRVSLLTETEGGHAIS